MPMTPRSALTIHGREITPDAADVLRAIETLGQRPIRPGSWWVQVGGAKYPLREFARLVVQWEGPEVLMLKHAQTVARHLGLTAGQEPGEYRPTGRPRSQ